MTTTAILFFVLAVVLVWGGLAVSIVRLRLDTRKDDSTEDTADERAESIDAPRPDGAAGPDGPRTR